MAIRPIDDRVVIRIADSETKSAGGIYLPDTAKEKPQKGTVVAVGNGRLLPDGVRSGMSLKTGDVVLYGKYSGNDVKIDGVEHKIMRESEILGKLEE
jgi:chaperonin GroES